LETKHKKCPWKSVAQKSNADNTFLERQQLTQMTFYLDKNLVDLLCVLITYVGRSFVLATSMDLNAD
jgi:hypothetical protein